MFPRVAARLQTCSILETVRAARLGAARAIGEGDVLSQTMPFLRPAPNVAAGPRRRAATRFAALRREIESRVIAIAEWARAQRIPALVGEGWVGYTPLHGTFEEGPTGRALAEHGIDTALEHGVWGVVLCSNAAPHHPMWEQRAQNARILAHPV